jgi:uncharacterized damage-inducible protein DinB
MIRSTRGFLLLSVVAAPLSAQAGGGTGNFGVTTAHSVWMMNATYITQSAQDMPEAKYAFKATPAVRSFGQLIGHVAGSQYMFCAAALGEPSRPENDIEKTKTSKADLIAAMQASTAYCEKAYAQTDAAARGEITMFGQKQTRMWALIMNAAHDGEHYGNIVTYLRLNDMVPPSSKGQ